MNKILYTLYGFYSVRSFWAVIFLVIGIILMIRWKKKNKSRRNPQLWIGAILAAASVVVLAAGCYNILLKPQFEHIKLSEQELTSFTEYLLEDERFLQKDKFMPNNETNYKEEDEEEKYSGQYVMYQPGSTVGYYLFTYDSSEEAKGAFIEKWDIMSTVLTKWDIRNSVPSQEMKTPYILKMTHIPFMFPLSKTNTLSSIWSRAITAQQLWIYIFSMIITLSSIMKIPRDHVLLYTGSLKMSCSSTVSTNCPYGNSK